MLPKCFNCGRDIQAGMMTPSSDDDYWQMPTDAVHFEGGSSYGSQLYDALIDGITVELVICDSCLAKNKDRVRHIIRDRFLSQKCCKCSYQIPKSILAGTEEIPRE